MKKEICRCFTLVELLTVIAVIGILAAIGFGTFSTAQNKSRISATRAVVENVANAFEAAKSDVGYAPSTNQEWQTISFNSSMEVSVGDTTPNSKFQTAFAKYADREMIRKFLDADNKLVDSWGKEIYYRYPGIGNRMKCSVLSAGPDGKFGNASENDDPPTSLSAYKDTGAKSNTRGEWTCDDVANF